MKNKNENPNLLQEDLRLILQTMRNVLIIMFICILPSQASQLYSQATRLTVNTENKSLVDIFKQIESSSEFLFNYVDSDVSGIKANVKVSEGDIHQILSATLKGTGLTYSVDDRHVVISKARNSSMGLLQDSKDRKVEGVVIDELGEPLIGVSVVEKGTENRTVTNIDGKYTILTNSNAVLKFTYLGFEPLEKAVGNTNPVSVTMREAKFELNEVVVTALGIKKEEKTLGYSLQQVNSEAFSKVKTDNPINRLNGKVAGLTVSTRAGILEDPSIKLRGKDPIYVVNGVPVEYYRAISNDDIESITVLKGGQASVLYGSRGADGAILITTKTGNDQKKKINVTANSSTMFTAGFLTLPEQQTVYGTGEYGQYAYKDGKGGGLYDGLWTWGPKLNQLDSSTPSGYWETPQYNSPIDPETGERIPLPFVGYKDNFKNFLQQGLVTDNNISASIKFDRGSMRMSLNQLYRKGQTPNTDLKKFGINVSGNYDLTSKLHFKANLLYTNTDSKNRHWSGYGNQHPYYNILVYMGANNNIKDLKNYWEPGQEGYQQRNWNHTWFNNPWFVAQENVRPYNEPETIISASLDYDIMEGMNFLVRAAADSKTQNHHEHKPYAWVGNDFGLYNKVSDQRLSVDIDAILSYKKNLSSDLDMDAMLGTAYYQWRQDYMRSYTDGGLLMPDVYNVSNSKNQPRTATAIKKERETAVYGSLTLGYKNALYMTFTGRNDFSSAFNGNNRSFFYPSVSFSGLVDQLIELPSQFSLLKLRVSWAKIGRKMGIYQLQDYYSFSEYWAGQASMTPEDILINKDIKPYYTYQFEVGADLRFFDNRLRADFSYYDIKDKGQIQEVDLVQATGYSKYLTNGNHYKRKGYELLLGGTPIKTDDWQWDLNFTWSSHRNYLDKIYNDANTYNNLKVGDRSDALYEQEWLKDPNGNFVVYEHNGRPIEDDYRRIVGYSSPNWEFGANTTLRFRNWSTTIDVSGRFGGVIRSDLNARMIEAGTHKKTAVPERELDWSKVASYIPPNAVIVTGGDIYYDDLGNILSDTRTFAPSSTPVFYKSWIGYLGKLNGPYTMGYNLYKADFVKLRSIALTYNFKDFLKRDFLVKDLELSIIGNNLWMWKKMDNEDPDASYKNFSYPTERMIGFNIKVSL